MTGARLAAYTRDGRSPTVLLLHGVFMDHTLWDEVLGLRSELRAEHAVDLLGELRIPWRAVGGAQDYAIAGGVADAIRLEGDLVVAPGGHTSPLEAPQVIADAVGAVVEEVDRPRA